MLRTISGKADKHLNKQYQHLIFCCREDYVHFAETCFKNFGDRVKHWMTINEPNLFTQMAYQTGKYPPARCSPPFGNCSAGNSDIEPLIAVHNLLLAHGKAVKIYRKYYQAIHCLLTLKLIFLSYTEYTVRRLFIDYINVIAAWTRWVNRDCCWLLKLCASNG